MKYLITLLLTVTCSFSMGQAITNMPLNSPSIGLTALTDQFSYDGKQLAHYGIGWYTDSSNRGGPFCYVSGYGGLKFFTMGRPVVTINNDGLMGIGTTSPIDLLDVNNGMAIVRNSAEDGSVYLSGGVNGLPCIQSANYVNNTARSFSINPYGGNVGIGTSTPESRLTVAGNIAAREVKVTVNAGADFVFRQDYNLKPLEELQTFIETNHHLPEIVPAKVMEAQGINIGEMNIQLLQKIEELTLYLIKQNQEIQKIQSVNTNLTRKIEQLSEIIQK